MFDRDHRDLGPAERLRRQNPAVARDNALLRIDQHRYIEAETRDAIGDLQHLRGFCGSSLNAMIGS